MRRANQRMQEREFYAPCECDPVTKKAHGAELIRSDGRSAFQMAHLKSIRLEETFEHFCGNPGCDEPYKGPHAVVWFTTGGKMQAEWVGVNRVLTPRSKL